MIGILVFDNLVVWPRRCAGQFGIWAAPIPANRLTSADPPAPSQHYDDHSGDEKRSKNGLVVSGKPNWKVDIKIVSPIICVPSSHACKRALPAIQNEYDYLQEYDTN